MTTKIPFRYGASFVDKATGLRVEAHHPASRPDLWAAYLEGAAAAFGRHGIDTLIDRQKLQHGDGVSLFFVGIDDEGRVVAGVRCHGPLDDPEAAQALAEMGGSSEIEQLRAAVGNRAPFGIIEIKGAWRASGHRGFFDIVPRCCVLSAEWLGAELTLMAVADRWGPALVRYGGVMMGSEGAPFPSERYRTVLVALHRGRYEQLLEPEQARTLREDAEQLRRAPDPQVVGWRPIILDTARRAQRQILACLRADPAVEIRDLLGHERQELDELLPSPGPDLVAEQPRYVYYPWRRTVVRMLGPAAFRAVRLDRNRNQILPDEQERLGRQRVGIVGLSTGHAIAATIALEGLCGELRLADFDDLELTNLNRIPASVLDVGVNKAVVAARRVAEIDPYVSVRIAPEGLNADNVDEFVSGLDIVIEQCDEIAMKLLVREVARHHRLPVVMQTSDRGMLDVERFDLEPDRPIFHGLVGELTSSAVGSLTTKEKVPHVLRILDPSQMSARMSASLVEIDRTLSSWPQLGSEVALGGASVATVVRRLGLGEPVPSGRTRVDIDAAVCSLEQPPSSERTTSSHELQRHDETHDETQTNGAVDTPFTTTRDPALSIVRAAILAPTCGNGQPWRFTLTDRELEVELVRSKGCGVMDVRSRASYVGVGAALFNARVAAARAHLLGAVRLFPRWPSSDSVATLSLEDGVDDELADLYSPMLERCSNRRHGDASPLDLAVVGRLTRAAAAESATLHLVSDRGRLAECAEIVAAAERIRFLTPELCRATMRELRWPGDDVRRGIDVATLEFAPWEIASLDLMRRTDVMQLLEQWDAGHALGDYLKNAVLAGSAIAVIAMSSSSSAAYVTGGMALERVWIEAQRAGLAVHAFAPAFAYAVQEADFETLCGSRWATELREHSDRFRDVVGLGATTAMALVLCLSHAPPPSARSLRLPVGSVLQRRPGAASTNAET